MGKKDNLFKGCIIFIVYIGLWVALVGGFISGDFSGLQVSLFSLVILYIWGEKETYKEIDEKAGREFVDIIIENIEDCLFSSPLNVIEKLTEIVNDPKNEFRKDRIKELRQRYTCAMPITYEANFHIKPNYKNLFEFFEKNHYSFPKIKNNDYIPKISIIGNFNNDFVQCFINGKYSKFEYFYMNYEKIEVEEYVKDYDYILIEINEKNIDLNLFRDLFCNINHFYEPYKFPFKSIVNEFKENYFLFNLKDEKNFSTEAFQEYNKYMIKNFSDNVKKELSHYDLKYDIDETLEWYNLDNHIYEYKRPDTKLSDLKILRLNEKNIAYWSIWSTYWRNKTPELFDISVKRHVFTHKFYTVYCDVGIYLNN
jgi:hypothetical protein